MVRAKPSIGFGVFLSLASMVMLLYLSSYLGLPRWRQQGFHLAEGTADRQLYLVDTPVCRIPDLDPFDPSIARFVRRRGKLHCPEDHPVITYVDGDFLRFNWTFINYELNKTFSHCSYQNIIRNHRDHRAISYGTASKNISAGVEMQDEFIRLKCYDTSGSLISTAFHGFPLLKKDVEERCDTNSKKHIELHRPKEVLSVLMVGVDSVSRLNLMRQMPLTREFLLKDLQAVEMLGYNKVADNTFPNIVPMLSGKFVKELPWNASLARKPFNRHPMIWKNFSANGYRTMFAEDAPNIAIFDYVKRGFDQAPTDYYQRGLALAIEAEKGVWGHRHHCVNNIPETEFHLRYTLEFVRQFSSKQHFSLTFLTRLTHASINMAGAADDLYLGFFKNLKEEDLLNNTVVVFFSDHGVRFGKIRKTYIGKAEERLPFLFLVFPEWFGKRYPELATNLRLNSNRLTTPFDVHETLKDILFFDGKVRHADVSQRGISLFREIPRNRSCAHAEIVPHWCTCMERKVVSPSSEAVRKVARWLVDTINSRLSNHSNLCAKLTLKAIIKAEEVKANDDVLSYDVAIDKVYDTAKFGDRVSAPAMYQLTIETVPGNGQFEATVMSEGGSNKMALQGDFSRVNRYGHQSECIDYRQLKKFCYCARRLRPD